MATPCDPFLDTKTRVRAGTVHCKKLRDLKIVRTIDKLKQACECTDSNCQSPHCDEMKSLVIHFKQCTIDPKRRCHLCKNFLAMCRYHAKRSRDCESQHCVVPYCAEIKHAMMLKKKQKRSEQMMLEGVLDFEEARAGCSGFTISNTDSEDAQSVVDITDGEEVELVEQTGREFTEEEAAQNKAQFRMLIEHAHHCQTQKITGALGWPCFRPSCSISQHVLNHAKDCTHASCEVLYCKTTRGLSDHWKVCMKRDCELCKLIRQSFATEGGILSYAIVEMLGLISPSYMYQQDDSQEICFICQKSKAMCSYHAKNCKEIICPMQCCMNIKFIRAAYLDKDSNFQSQVQPTTSRFSESDDSE